MNAAPAAGVLMQVPPRSSAAAFAVLFALVAFTLCACGESERGVLRVHHFVPATSTIHKDMIVPWCERVRNDSNGELECQIFPAMQLGGSPTQLYDQVRDGVVDVVFAAPGFSAGRFPKIEVFELPFMMTDAQASSKALWDYVAQDSQSEFSDVHPLAFNVHGPGLVHTVGKAVNSRADLRGLKIRAPTRQSSKLVAALGATPIGMPLPQVPEALSRNVIDGVMVPWEIVPAIKADELTHFHSETDRRQGAIYTTAFLFAMNKARYESLTPVQKKAIDANSGVELSGRFGQTMSDADARGKASVAAESVTIIPAGEIAQWRRLTRPVIDEWVDEMNRNGADGKALLASAHRLTENYNP